MKLVALALLGVVVALVLWGIWGEGRVAWHGQTHLLGFSARDGRFYLMRVHARTDRRIEAVTFDRRSMQVNFPDGSFIIQFDGGAPPLLGSSLGFGTTSMLFTDPTLHVASAHRFYMPQWPLLVISAALVMLAIWPQSRRYCKKASNHCPVCGYDLRASPARCPECGTPAAEHV